MLARNKIKWFLFFLFLLSLWDFSQAAQWINPKDLIGDPNFARFQQGRKELTPEEKEEIKKYGFTGLELITYVHANDRTWQDHDLFERETAMNASGVIQIGESIERYKYYFKNYKARLTLDGIKPGDTEQKSIGFALYPSKDEGDIWMGERYLRSKDLDKEDTGWSKSANLRRIRRSIAQNRQDKTWGTDMTRDDRGRREPWEENHKILGEDNLMGKECFVVESKMGAIPNYYLSKRVIWIEKKNFFDIHEEQWDRKGKLFKIMDKEWIQVKPWNYWVLRRWYAIDLSTNSRTLEEELEWIFDQGIPGKAFSTKALMEENPWRLPPKDLPPRIEKASDFPPPPQVRWEFWKKLGIEPVVYK